MSNNQFSLLTETDGAAKASGSLKPRGPIPKQTKVKPAAKPQAKPKAKPTPTKSEAPKKKVIVENTKKYIDKDEKKQESLEKKKQLEEMREERKYGRVMDRKSGTGVPKNKTKKGDAELKMEIKEGVDKYQRSKNLPIQKRNNQAVKKEKPVEKKEEKPVEKKEEKPVEKKEEKPVEKKEKPDEKKEETPENEASEVKVEEAKEVVEEEKKPEKKEIKQEDMLSYEEYLKKQENKKTIKAEPITQKISAENMIEVQKKELVRERGEEKKKKTKQSTAPKKEKLEISIADMVDISYVQKQPPQQRRRNDTENKKQYSSVKQEKPQQAPKSVPMNSTKKFPSLSN